MVGFLENKEINKSIIKSSY